MKGSKTHYEIKPSEANLYIKPSLLKKLEAEIKEHVLTGGVGNLKNGQGVFLFEEVDTERGKAKIAMFALWSYAIDKKALDHFQIIEYHLYLGKLPETVVSKIGKPGSPGKWDTILMNEQGEQPKVIDLKSKCWQLIDILRSEIISPSEYTIILYLLSLYRNRIDLRISKREDQAIQVVLPSEITSEQDHADPRSIFGRLPLIHDVFKPILETLGFRTLEMLLNQIRSMDHALLNKHFGLIFDDLIYKINSYLGKLGGVDIQPLELTKFVCGLSSLPANAKVYNPFAGLASFSIFLGKDVNYLGQEISQKTWALGSLRILAHDQLNTSRFSQGDSIRHWNPGQEKYDLIIANPPFGMRLPQEITGRFGSFKTCESYFIEKGIDDLNDTGKLIAIIPNRFLFSGGSEQRLRQYIIEHDLLEMVVSFPSGVMPNTGILISVVVINKYKKEKGLVRFIDAKDCIDKTSIREKRINDFELNRIIKDSNDSESLRIVSNDTIKDSGYDFSIPRYFAPIIEQDSHSNLIALSDFVRIIRGQRATEGSEEKFVRIRNLKEDKLDYLLDVDHLPSRELDTRRQQLSSKLISESCLLLATRWQTLKPTYFKFTGESIALSQDIIALKIDETKVDVGYLINELNSSYVSEQADAFRTGAVILNLRKEDLLNIKIKLPIYHNQLQFGKSLEEQRAKVQGVLEALRSDKKKELMLFEKIHGLENEIVEQNTYLRHTLAGPTSNLIGSVANIKKIIESKVLEKVPEIMTLKLSDKHELTFGQYFEIIERDIKKISEAVSRRLKVETGIESKPLMPVDVIDFLTRYANELASRKDINFKVEFTYDTEAFLDDNGNTLKTFINGNPDLLTDLFNNLVSNAVAHAFSNNKKDRIEIHLMKFEEEESQGDITILFSNTGKPFPENFTKQDFIRKGSKTGSNAGDGFGGWYINEIVERLKGRFAIIDETSGEGLPDTDLATSFEINFPIIESEENEEV